MLRRDAARNVDEPAAGGRADDGEQDGTEDEDALLDALLRADDRVSVPYPAWHRLDRARRAAHAAGARCCSRTVANARSVIATVSSRSRTSPSVGIG
jgi:hypothetical protein